MLLESAYSIVFINPPTTTRIQKESKEEQIRTNENKRDLARLARLPVLAELAGPFGLTGPGGEGVNKFSVPWG